MDQALADRPEHAALLDQVHELYQEAACAVTELSDMLAELGQIITNTVEHVDLPALPEAEEGAPDDDLPLPSTLFDSSRSFVETTRRLKAERLTASEDQD